MSVVECTNVAIPSLCKLPAALNDAFQLEEDAKGVITIPTGARVQETVVIPENSSVNIDNSSDVIIGPVTQFHGPVTIYQGERHAQPVNLPYICPDDNHGTYAAQNGNIKCDAVDEEQPDQKKLCSREALCTKRGLSILSISCLFVSGLLITISYLVASSLQNAPGPPPDFIGEDLVDGYAALPGPGTHFLIYRSAWGGRPPLNGTRPLAHPARYVIIIHTVTNPCVTVEKCKARVASIQAYHVANLGQPDVGYSFLVGGDGNVYVGRGWDVVNYSRNDSISVAFVGNYIFDQLSEGMVEATRNLMVEGVRLGKLSERYTLVCHNQTKATQSPGPNVYKVVKKWPHFSPELLL